MTKEQALNSFHNAIGEAITENLCGGNIGRQDILEADLWSREEIADLIEELTAQQADDVAWDAAHE